MVFLAARVTRARCWLHSLVSMLAGVRATPAALLRHVPCPGGKLPLLFNCSRFSGLPP